MILTENSLDPNKLASLKNLKLVAKLVVEGFITGIHKSPFHGFSAEFAEHRSYRPGDEFRHIDWKVYGRSDKFVVKQFEEETNLRSTIVVDSSKSMLYSSKGNISKYQYAIMLAASLAYLLNNQRDAIGLAMFSNKLIKYLPSSSKSSYIGEIIRTLENFEPSDDTNFATSLDLLAEQIKRRGMVIIISDFFDSLESISNALRHFRHNHHEVVLFQILDPKEIDFDLGDSAVFIDMETQQELLTNPHQLKSAYKDKFEDYLHQLKEICYKTKVDYNMALTNQGFDKSLINFVAKRSKVAG